MASLPAGSVDLVLCDPPYGTTACRWDSVIPLDPMWQAVDRLSKPRTPAVFTAAQPFTTALIASNLAEFKYCWYWDKVLPRGHLNSKKQPLRRIEDIAVFYAAQPTYIPQKTKGHSRKIARTRYTKKADGSQVYGAEQRDTFYDSDERYPDGLLAVSNAAQTGKVHPTQKPVELMAYLIRTYTNPGDVVLDFTMGSGTTGVAAMQEGRQFIGIERDPEYYALACNRIMAARAC